MSNLRVNCYESVKDTSTEITTVSEVAGEKFSILLLEMAIKVVHPVTQQLREDVL